MAGIQKVTDRFQSDAVVNVPPIAVKFDDTVNDTDKSFVVPGNELWKMNFMHVILVTDVTVANRELTVQVSDADGNLLIDLPPGAVQAASLTRHYGYLQGVQRETSFSQEENQGPLPEDMYLAAGYTIRFFDGGSGGAGDDMTVSFQYQKFQV